jgi:hypothetical protein
MACLRSNLVCALICSSVLPAQGVPAQGADLRGRGPVLGTIFADQQVSDWAWYVHRRAGELPETERFEYLESQVLPGPDHETFRLALGFSPTHPAPAFRDAADERRVAAAREQGLTRVSTGGRLVSPALDLIESATRLQRLPELRARIAQAPTGDELHDRCRLALLGIVDIALHDFERALESLDELFDRVRTQTYDEFSARWPETLAIHEAIQHPETRNVASELLYQMLQSQVRSGVARGPDAWDRWVTATAGRLRSFTEDLPQAVADDGGRRLRNWAAVSRTTAWSRGQGLPCAVWRVTPGLAENLASHDEDYLYYRIPLRGEFEVECDVNSFGWRDTHLMVAGTYVAPIYDRVTYGLGSFRGARPAGTIDPPLSECGEWIHYRTVVRDGACATYFNGRLIHVEPLPPDHDPWLAVRSAWYADGSVRNLTIRGTPAIPDRIRLSRSRDLTGWSAYHGEPVGGDGGYWRHVDDSGGTIVGRREPWLAGAAVERLLQYHRPMLEDGTIEYEFYYRDDEVLVHPALDRRAFILDRDGVRSHQVTDGIFERTAASPRKPVPDHVAQKSSATLPLLENDWNRMRLSLVGDRVQLFLNDQPVYRGEIVPSNQRTFGLFHWADQTEARVRNVDWTGSWPQKLPPVAEQEMAGDGHRFLDERLPELTARFEHDFTRNGLPDKLFRVQGASTTATIEPGEGVRLQTTSTSDSAAGWISPNLRIHGDFDIRVEFARLETSGPIDSSCGMFLMTVTDDPEYTHSGVYRGTLRRPNTPDRQVIQSEFNRNRNGGNLLTWPGTTSEAATSGTLRLARRGDQIHCLFAEADSATFRHVHTETVPTDATILDGVRLTAATYSIMKGDCECAVTWKRLSIRADDITDRP